MKLCDLTSFYSDKGGGVRTYHQHKLAYFAKHKEHEYIMVTAGKKNSVINAEGGKIYTVRGFPVSKDAQYRQIYDYFQLRKILGKEKPDALEVGSPYLDCWLVLLSLLDFNPAIVGLYHADFPDSYIAPAVSRYPKRMARRFVGFWKGYVRFTYQKFDATGVTSRYIEDKVQKFGITNTVRLPLGVDHDVFNPHCRNIGIRQNLGMNEGDKLLLYAGRFSSEKGIEPLIKSIEVLSKRPGIQIALAGHGPLEDQARKAAAGSPNVHWLGFIEDRKKLASLYATSDLFLAPGPYETFGLATLEAMSSGLPVVAASSGGNGELVKQSGAGLVFKSQDYRGLIAAVDALLRSDLKILGKRAREFAEQNFSWETTFDRMVATYNELIFTKRSDPRLTSRRLAGV